MGNDMVKIRHHQHLSIVLGFDPLVLILDNEQMNTMTYTQFCLDQMQVKTWQFHSNQYGLISNQENQPIGHLLLAPSLRNQAEGEVNELMSAMLRAIDLQVGPLQYSLPEKSDNVQFLLIMGEVKVNRQWEKLYPHHYSIVHPVEMIKNSGLKRDAWKVLQGIKF